MYTVAISGSPRKMGTPPYWFKRFISLAGLNINPCDSCDRCWRENIECVIDDDIRWIIREMEKADVIILGSPCYFGNVSAQLKMLIDRTVSIHEKDTLKNKIGAAAVTQDVYGSGRGGELVRQAIAHFMIPEMVYAGGIIGEGGAEIGHFKKDKRAMKEAKDLAKRIIELHEKLKKDKQEKSRARVLLNSLF